MADQAGAVVNQPPENGHENELVPPPLPHQNNQLIPPQHQQMVAPPPAEGGARRMPKRECSCISDLISCACNCGDGFAGLKESEITVLEFSENNSNQSLRLRESLDRFKEAKIERAIRRGEAREVAANDAPAPAIAAIDAPAAAIDDPAPNNYLPPPGYVLVPAGAGGGVCEVFNDENANGCVIM